MYLKYTNPYNPISYIPCNYGKVTIIDDSQQIIVIDPGYIGQRTSAPSWMHYTLLPHIIKTTGRTTIDHLIVLQPSSWLFQAIERLATKMGIKNIYLVYWHNKAPAPMMRNFMALKNMCAAKNITLHRIFTKPITIPLAKPSDTLRIVPLPDTIITKHIEFPSLQVQGSIDNQEITLYSARYKKLRKLIQQTE